MSLNRLWSALAVDTCIGRGIDHFFIAPGSRCTPLTLAIAQDPRAAITQHVDERSLAFAAVGYAKATGKPAAFVCTSGTAVANALPAVVEAAMEHVPLLLLTADRPPELRETGANQTIDQTHLFGQFVRWFFDMPCPDASIPAAFVRGQFDYAIEKAATGPVHMNCMFREPFAASDEPVDISGVPLTASTPSRTKVNSIQIPGGTTLLVVGGCRPAEAKAACLLAERLEIPIISDICSGLRHGSTDLARDFDLPRPETVIHVGGRVVSKFWHRQLGGPDQHVIHLTSSGDRLDPYHTGIERWQVQLDQIHEGVSLARPSSNSFRTSWQAAERRRREAIATVLKTERVLSEPSVAFAISGLILPGRGMFLGNSLPIRDIDSYCHWENKRGIQVGANRGASGIDGLIGSAVGFAKGLNHQTTLIVGDLSALHDLNALAMVRQSNLPITVLIMNNHGGGIFDCLPVAKETVHFERYFTTPHELSFSSAAEMFDLPYEQPHDLSEFQASFRRAMQRDSSSIIEVATERTVNLAVRARIREEIRK